MLFFFVKQKTAYEMRISDWSSDVCSSDLAAAQVAIIGEVASNYIQARLAQQRLETARDTLAIADENLEIAGWRVQAGLVSSLDEEQAKAQRAPTAASIPGIESDFASAPFRLAVLTGQGPCKLPATLSGTAATPTGPNRITLGTHDDTQETG